MKNIFFKLILVTSLFSCKETTDLDKVNNEAVIKTEKATKENLNVNSKVKIEIVGMTCVIGCVKTIQSRLTKMNGVFEVEMDFEEERSIDYATVSFDSDYVTEKLLVQEIESIAQGIYKVKSIEKLSIDQ